MAGGFIMRPNIYGASTNEEVARDEVQFPLWRVRSQITVVQGDPLG